MKSLIVLAAVVLAVSSCASPESRTPGVAFAQPAGAPRGAVQTYADVVERVAPAVVTVRSERRSRAPQQHPFLNDPFFRDFFGAPGPAPQAPRVERGLGSGVLVSADGYVLTNHHVVDGAEEIEVELVDRRTFRARIVGSDPPSDLAVLRVDGARLPALALGNSDRVRVGDVVLAVGNPLGVGQTVTAGIVSAKGRATGLSDGSFEDFLQTDAPINRGNSGGALVNTAGEWIGINSQILSPSGGSIGIGFAIPANMARNVMDQLVRTGRVRRGQLGVGIQPVTADMARSLGLREARGAIVNSVVPGGPAARAGVRQGDVIVAIDGDPVADGNVLRNRIAAAAPGSSVRVTVLRDGREQQLHVRLGELPGEAARATPARDDGGAAAGGALGLTVEPLTAQLATRLGVERGTQGVVVTGVDPAGPAAQEGVQAGDVIVNVDRVPVRSAGDLRGAVQRAGERPVLVLLQRGDQSFFVTVQPRS